MAIPLIGGLSSAQLARHLGETYQPKQQRLMVGRDVAAMTHSPLAAQGTRDVVVGSAEDTRFSSKAIFSTAAHVAKSGFMVRDFRQIGNQAGISGNILAAAQSADGQPTLPTVSNGNYSAAFDGNTLTISEKRLDEDGKEKWRVIRSVEVKGDTRLSWDEEGKPAILTGSAALSHGKLTAKGDNEMLIRRSSVNVEAGNGTMIINQGAIGGRFSGGSGVTYLGSYQGGTIEGAIGDCTFGGYFQSMEINANENSAGTFSGVFEGVKIQGGDGGNVFSGYFRMGENIREQDKSIETEINGGNGKNRFDGLFLGGCVVNGGEDEDKFTGRFIDSKLSGGAGDDTFGSGVRLNQQVAMFVDNGEGKVGNLYNGLESDFVGSIVEGDEGDDTFNSVAHGGEINLGDGDDSAYGVFSEAQVDVGDGDDDISAMYARNSTFKTGLGDDKVDLATAMVNSVITGQGRNTINLGRDMPPGASDGWTANTNEGDGLMGRTTWQTRNEFFMHARPYEHGELHGNVVKAEKGDNSITVKNGDRTHQVTAADERTGESAQANAAGQPADQADDAAESTETSGSLAGFGNKSPDDSAEALDTSNRALLNLALLRSAADNGQSLLEAARGGSLSLDEPNKAQKQRFVNRYVLVSGDPAREEGSEAVSIATGVGDPLVFNTAERLLQRGNIGIKQPKAGQGSYHHHASSGPGMFVASARHDK